MTADLGLRVCRFQIPQEEVKGSFLFRRTRIGILSILILATNVADANGMLVVVAEMGSGHGLRTACLNGSVRLNNPVVAAASPASGSMHSVKIVDCHLDVGLRGGTVYHEPQNFFHRKHLFHHLQLWTKKVDTTAVIIVKTKFAILLIVSRLIIILKIIRV